MSGICRWGGILLGVLLAAIPRAEAMDPTLAETEEAYLLSPGQVRLRAGLGVERQPDGSLLYDSPRVGLDAGIGTWAEAGLEYAVRSIADSPLVDHKSLGSGELMLSLKLAPAQWESGRFGCGIGSKWPNASARDGLGSNENEFAFKLLLSQDLTDTCRMHLNAGLGLSDDPGTEAAQDAYFLYSAALEWRIAETWSVWGEVAGSEGSQAVRDITGGLWSDHARLGRVAVEHSWEGGWGIGLSVAKGMTDLGDDWAVGVAVRTDLHHPGSWMAAPEASAGRPAPACRAGPAEPLENRLVTQTAVPLDAGVVRVDGGAEIREQADDSHLWDAPRFTMRIGLGPEKRVGPLECEAPSWSELAVTASYRTLRGSPRFGGASGAGDVWLGWKISPWEWGHFRPGLLVFTKLPGADDREGLGTGQIDAGAKALATWDLDGVRLHANLGVAILDSPRRPRTQSDSLLYGVGADIPLCEHLWLVGEVNGSTQGSDVDSAADGWAGPRRIETRWGLAGRLDESWSWGALGSVGFGGNADDWTVTLGVTKDWK